LSTGVDRRTIDFVSALTHEEPRVHLIIVGRRGLGLALLAAYEYAVDELQAFTSRKWTPISPRPLAHGASEALADGYDLSIGSR
jgi:hypothetical protein